VLAKEYLSELKLKKIRIEQLQEQRQTYLEMATSITASLNPVKVQSNSSVDKMGDNVTNAEHMVEKIHAENERMIDRRMETIELIYRMSNARYIRLLSMIYIYDKTIEEVAAEMQICTAYVNKLHKKALVEFEEMNTDALAEWEQKRKGIENDG
jgi:DNA-directed RNA polymerase specialized sigma subunit